MTEISCSHWGIFDSASPLPLEPMEREFEGWLDDYFAKLGNAHPQMWIMACGRPHWKLCDVCHKNGDKCAREGQTTGTA